VAKINALLGWPPIVGFAAFFSPCFSAVLQQQQQLGVAIALSMSVFCGLVASNP
jgi:hypothetical protein